MKVLIALLFNFWAFRFWIGPLFWFYLLFLTWKFTSQTFHRDGGLPIRWVRHSFLAQWFTDFFPIKLHRTHELDSNQRYLFGYHPHGIIG